MNVTNGQDSSSPVSAQQQREAIREVVSEGCLKELMSLTVEDASQEAVRPVRERVVSFLIDRSGLTEVVAEELVEDILRDVEATRHLPVDASRLPDHPFGEVVEAGTSALRWAHRKHFFEAIQRIAPHVLKEVLNVAGPIYDEFIHGIDAHSRRHLVEWEGYGSSTGKPQHCLPLAIETGDFENWPPVAGDLGSAIKQWIEKYRLAAAESDPLWVIEATLYRLEHQAKGRDSNLGDWWTPNYVSQNIYFDEAAPPPMRGWHPQREQTSAPQWLKERIKELNLYLAPRRERFEHLKDEGVLVSAPTVQDEVHFNNLVQYQILKKERREITGRRHLDKVPAMETMDQRIAKVMHLVLAGNIDKQEQPRP